MIYDEKAFPEDLKIFNSTDWQLAPLTEKVIVPPKDIPSRAFF